MNVVSGPVFSIQPKWKDILSTACAEIWVSCKSRNENLKKGKVIRKLSEKGDQFSFTLSTTNDFLVNLLSPGAIVIGLNDLQFSCLFLAPVNTYETFHEKCVTSLDVSVQSVCVSVSNDEDECLIVTWLGDSEKKFVSEQDNSNPSRKSNTTILSFQKTCRYHDGSIYKCRWFPTGQALVSFGENSILKLWCSETCRSPVSLEEHTGVVTDIAFVNLGQNIISVSKDGYCKLWNCNEQRCIANIIELPIGINCCSISSVSGDVQLPEKDTQSDEGEIGTENKVILVGCEDGTICCIAVHSRKEIFKVQVQSVVNCSCCIKSAVFAVGLQDGSISLLDVLNDNDPILISWFETDSPVLSATSFQEKGFFVGHEDGRCLYRTILDLNCPVRLGLCGSDGFAIHDVCCDAKYVYTACADAKIRTYFPHSFIDRYFSDEKT